MFNTRMIRLINYRRFPIALIVFFLLFHSEVFATDNVQWNEIELAILKMQWIGSLPSVPADKSNQYADNIDAARFGHKLFFDPRFSSNGKVSCASCHIPEKSFTDGLATAKGVGNTLRSTPSLIGVAYSPWFFWDGSSDSLWSQALSPLESDVEHGGNRMQYAHIIYNDADYRKAYQKIFGSLPDLSDLNRFPKKAALNRAGDGMSLWNAMTEMDRNAITRVFVNMSKAIAAYERLLLPSVSRFDEYVTATMQGEVSNALTKDEIAGLKLFIGKAMCVTCHQGPLFTNHGFHNVGAPDPANKKSWIPFLSFFIDKPLFDVGRYKGVKEAQANEFNCLGNYSDANDSDCAELKFANTKYLTTLGAFKVPTLRNIGITAPYFHFGQFTTLGEVIDHYNKTPEDVVGHNELTPLELTKKEMAQLEAFLHSLTSPLTVKAEWLSAPN